MSGEQADHDADFERAFATERKIEHRRYLRERAAIAALGAIMTSDLLMEGVLRKMQQAEGEVEPLDATPIIIASAIKAADALVAALTEVKP